MAYVVAMVVFVTVLLATVLVFGQLMTRAYIDGLRAGRWGRVLNGLVMTAIALVAALIAVWLVR
jgi:hypothetical protein